MSTITVGGTEIPVTRIDELNQTVLPNRDHLVPAMREGLTVRLTIAQVLGLIAKGDMLGKLLAEDIPYDPGSAGPLTAGHLQAALDEMAEALMARVSVDHAQSFSDGEQAQARANIGLALDDLKWLSKGIGEYYFADDGVDGVDIPPTDDPRYRYALLTAGETGVGEYNEGILTSESVSGSAPLVQATAVIDLSGSPMDGQTIHLINTERRFLRAGDAGAVQADQGQQITGTLPRMGGNHVLFVGGLGAFTTSAGSEFAVPSGTSTTLPYSGTITFDSADSPNARAGTETRPKNIGINVYRRIK